MISFESNREVQLSIYVQRTTPIVFDFSSPFRSESSRFWLVGNYCCRIVAFLLTKHTHTLCLLSICGVCSSVVMVQWSSQRKVAPRLCIIINKRITRPHWSFSCSICKTRRGSRIFIPSFSVSSIVWLSVELFNGLCQFDFFLMMYVTFVENVVTDII